MFVGQHRRSAAAGRRLRSRLLAARRCRWYRVSVVDLENAREKRQKPNNILVGVAGFEPATPASRTQCSTGLSHTPTRTRLIAFGLAHRKKPDEGREIPVDVGLNTQILPANDAAVASAAQCLKRGGLVAFPTETVYGL